MSDTTMIGAPDYEGANLAGNNKILMQERIRERFDMIAKDCPWKCRFDSRRPCLCRAAAR